KDKTSSLYVPSDTKQLVQQKLATNIHHILILLQRATLKDSRTTGFAILRIFCEFLLNFKVHCKNYKGALAATIQLSHGLHRLPPGFLEILTRGPRPLSERRHGVDRPKPARGVTGAEGGGVWEVHRTRVHLSMPGIEV